jgi:chromosome partitioning protein
MPKSQSKVVSFINMKGGVGKTTLAVNIAYTLSKQFGKRVLLIDVDPQMNTSQYTLNAGQVKEIMMDPKRTLCGILSEEFGVPGITSSLQKSPAVSDVIFKISEKFYIIPSHLAMMGLDLDKRIFRLKNYIKENNLKNDYDIIILDLPPTISVYTNIALLASDLYLVPMKTDFLSLFGLPLLENYILRLQKEYDHPLDLLGIVLTMVRPELKIYKDVKSKLLENRVWSDKIFKGELKYRTEIEKSLSPEEKDTFSPFIIELGKEELRSQMINITTEFMQRMRL